MDGTAGVAPLVEDTTLPAGRAIVAAVVLTAIGVISIAFLPPLVVGGIMIFVALLFLARRIVFSWVGWLGILVAVVMFIPVRRYAVPIPLPFQLEPYRLVLLLLALGMVAALLLDKNRRWQPVAFGWPIGLFFATLIISIPMNGTDLVVTGLGSAAVGAIVNYVLMLACFYITRQIMTTETIVVGLLTALVWCGSVVALFSIAERVTRVNLFWRLGEFLPLQTIADETEAYRAGGFRSFGSAQHPIALSVMLCLLIPIAIYLAKYGRWPRNEMSRRLVYSFVSLILLAGVLTAVSRTAVVVLAIMFVVTLIFRPWLGITIAAIATPLVALGAAVVPKVFDTMIGSFFDLDSLIASQQTSPGFRGAGRLADLGPSLLEASGRPFFGSGVGSRIVTGPDQNAFILDNQVMGTLLETGAVGVFGLAVLALAPPIMLLVFGFTTGRRDPKYALLALSITVAASGYAAALFFYDAFGFYQSFFVYTMILAAGAWVITASPPALANVAEGRTRYEAAPPVLDSSVTA